MRIRNWLPFLLCLAAASAQAGQIYRWLDQQGKTHFSDQSPPPNARSVQSVTGKGNVVEVDKESYASKQARAENPVVLYASAGCGYFCDMAQVHLKQRGIAYSVKDPSKEPEHALELKKLIGTMEVPVIVIGNAHQKGYEASLWDKLLDAAGYPRTPLIPTRPEPQIQPSPKP